ncbi:MAG: hypothetical protein AAGI72_23715 [Pseudomonadota bacterium]
MDTARFVSASFKPREASVAVPALAEFFEEGEAAEWKVRGLTGAELARAKSADQTMKNMKTLVEAVATGNNSDAIRKLAGVVDEGTPPDLTYRIQILVDGSVDPSIDAQQRDVAVRLAEAHPVIFYQLTSRILELTGEGQELGKRGNSGKTTTSATSS